MSKKISLSLVKHIFYLYKTYGGSKYTISEPITQYEHSLQSYDWMKKYLKQKTYLPVNTKLNLCLSSFLHDIGHLLNKKPIDPKSGINDKHELNGYTWLSERGFSDYITFPILKHVDAKRYLSTIMPDYYSKLSEGSKISLELQGGLMTNKELSLFKASFCFNYALLIRQADDSAKELKISKKVYSQLEKEVYEDMLKLDIVDN